ncbi:uncharacterized protein LOC108914277 [Anoplophora glabripennis]|uniref:uncharacterized protein LOC108914277 n=1 Tax=Anoplophora glabripennis TaxID=217634 RepID=UPI000873F34D|nr:uncharacterized protein LOC108914277 [Anoplophora glabripennis]
MKMNQIRFGITYDYYWRNYTGIIPRDAIEGGRDVNNMTTYIGQVSVKNQGVIPATIYPGNTTVVAVAHGVHRVSSYIKILCSATKQNIKWMHVDSRNFQVLTTNRHLVQGGVENDIVTYIGRIRYQGETVVTKVREHGIGNVKLYYPAGNQEKSTDSFEVLIYDR